MDRRTGRSVFDPYYSRIQELLFSGMSIKAIYDYVEKDTPVICYHLPGTEPEPLSEIPPESEPESGMEPGAEPPEVISEQPLVQGQ